MVSQQREPLYNHVRIMSAIMLQALCKTCLQATSVLFVLTAAIATLRRLLLACNTAWAAAPKGRGQGKVNMFLAVEAYEVGGDVADLPPDADVALADEHTCVMDRLGKAQLEDLGLQAPLHDLRSCQAQHVIE